MHTLTMPIEDAILASKALLNHASTDDITPIICGAAVLELDGKHYLVATDRYSFGRFLLGTHDKFEGEAGQIIPRDALTWVSKIVLKGLRKPFALGLQADNGYQVRFSWSSPVEGVAKDTEVEVAITYDGKAERSQTYDAFSGNYPPVARLWREGDELDAPVSKVNLSHLSLSKVASDVMLFLGKHDGVTLHFAADKDTGKPAPVQYTLGDGGRWTAALQPNLMLR